MKLTALILLVASMVAGAKGNTQNISLSVKNESLEKVFAEIKKQSGYSIFYNYRLLDNTKPVTINVKNVSVDDAMEICLQGQQLDFEISGKSIVITAKAVKTTISEMPLPPPIDVRGKVVNESGEGVEGVTITVKGSNKATSTNANGDFELRNVDENITLVFTGINVETQEVRVNGRANLGAIILKARTTLMDDINVTVSSGYQNLLKARSPGTISHIGRDIISNRPATDLSASLDGLVAGMQAVENASGKNTFIIRGISTLDTANRQRLPLIVIDGFALASTDFSTINPNDVESVDVLKDAAATAVWGARATNGVIVITTKKGTSRKGVTIDGSAFISIAPRPNLDQFVTTANSAQTIAYEKWAVANNFYGGTAYQGGVFPGEFNRSLTLAQEFMYDNRFRGLPTAAMNASLDSLSQINNQSQIRDYLLQNTVTSQYNISFNYRGDRTRTYASLLFENNQDRYIGNKYQKFNMNIQNEFNLAKFLTFNINAFLLYNDQSSSGGTLAELRNLSPYETLINSDDSYSAQINTYNRYLLTKLPLNKFPYQDLSYNLLREIRGRNLTAKNYYARLQTGFAATIIPGLTLDAKFQYERGTTNSENYYSDNTFYVRQMIDNYTAYNNTTGVVGNSLLPKGSINQAQINNITNYNLRGQFSYVKDIGKYSINATAGGEISEARTDGRINPWQYGYNRETQTSIVPPYGYGSSVETFIASTITGGNTNNLPGGVTTLSYGLDRFVSYFGASNITYNGKYTLTLNIRGDGSNYITDIPSLRWSPFWSVGGNWDITGEKFMTNNKWINYLHLRVSYGSTGAANKTTSTEALLNMGTSPNAGTGTITASVSSYGNPYLHWERTYSTNVGVDFGLFTNKLNGSINVYNKSGKDITGNVTLPSVYGVTSQKFNAADLVNRGIEVQLGTTLKLPIGFSYSTSFNYAYNWNQITKLYFPTQSNYTLTTGGGFVQGRPVNAYYTYDYAGVNTAGQPMFIGPNKLQNRMSGSVVYFLTDGLTGGYLRYAGTITPPHTMGWRHGISYNGFTLTALFTGTFGGTFLNPTFNYGVYAGNGKTIVSRFVDQPLSGDPSVVPFPSAADIALAGGGVPSWQYYSPFLTHNVESSSYIQLKELYLKYDLPQSLLRRAKIRNLSVFAQGRDLGMIWNNNTHNYNPDFLPGTNRPLPTYTLGVRFGL